MFPFSAFMAFVITLAIMKRRRLIVSLYLSLYSSQTSSCCLTTNSVQVSATSETDLPGSKMEPHPKLGKILITSTSLPEVGTKKLERNFDLIFLTSFPPQREEILRLSNGTIGIMWIGHTLLDAEALDAAGPQLKAISTTSAGLDHVDIPEVKRRNIALGHTPDVVNDAVADLAIGLMIAAGRRFHESDLKIRKGEFYNTPDWMFGKDIRSSTVGIVGLGGIGQVIAKRLQGFDIGQLLYTGRNRKDQEVEKKFNAKYATFTELIKSSDYVFIATPLTNETRNMFNRTVFDQMKPTSVLVNIARGGIVNTMDLYEALKEKKIFAAGLDVTDPEPLPLDHPLLTLDNVVLVPHLGTATDRARNDMVEIAALNILTGIAGEPMFAPVP